MRQVSCEYNCFRKADDQSQYSLGSFEYRTGTTLADSCGPLPYSHHRHFPDFLLFHMRNPTILANFTSLSCLYLTLLHSTHIGDREPPEFVFAFSSSLVVVCILFSRSTAPLRTTSADTKIYIWLPSTWNHLPWCVCSVWNGSAWVFQTFSGDNQHSTYSRFQFPYSLLQGVCSRHGACKRLTRVL